MRSAGAPTAARGGACAPRAGFEFAVNMLPYIGPNRAGIQGGLGLAAFVADIESSGRWFVVEDQQDFLAVRGFEGDIGEGGQGVGSDADGTGPYEFGGVRKT